MGLSIVKSLVELLGGTIQVISKVSKGSCFSVSLPIGNVESVSPPVQDDLAKKISTDSSLKVLYIEDKLVNLDFLTQLFNTRPNIELIGKVTGIEGIEVALQCLPDIILLDIQLPDKNGLDVYHFLRNHTRTSDIPIIICADAMVYQVKKTLELGAEGYITKPIKIPEFWDTFDQVMAKTKEA